MQKNKMSKTKETFKNQNKIKNKKAVNNKKTCQAIKREKMTK